MRFGVLGTLTVVDDDGGIRPLGGPARRRLLAALVARHGRTVSVDSLLADLWGDSPPATAEKTLQSHVVRLRDALGRDEDGSPIRTDPTGYRLEVEPAAIDAWCFERDLAAGRQALADGDLASAVALLDQALAWWRDDAYVEFPDATFAVIERLRLFELRCLAAEARTDVALELGAGAELVGDLETRVREDPYRERTWEQLVIALYRSGRQADALTAYRRARARLVDDLGVEPSPALRALEARVLDQDPALDAPARPANVVSTTPGPAAASPSPPSPAPEPVPVPVDPASPYRGLASYGEDDTDVFVGRERLTAELCGRLVDNDLLVVTGPSGAGKSSLVRAGLAPALRRGAVPGSKAWRIRIVTPGADPVEALDARRCELLIVDQAEELFTLGSDDDLRRVRLSLAATLRAGTMLVLAVRGDFYGRLADLDLLTRRIGGATVLVGPMTEDETRRVVVEPAARHGVTVEPDLVDEILTDVAGRSGALPLLSAALEQAWGHRDGDRLTLVDYRRGGGVRGALEAMAEDTYASLDPEAKIAARRMLLRLTTLSGSTWVRRPMPLDELVPDDDDAAHRALEVLATRRLVLVDAGGVELTHESLLTGWPRLGRWLEERALFAGQLEHLASSAVGWDRIGRPDAELLRGPRLQAALEWRAQHPTDLTGLEQDYLAASQHAIGEALRTERRRRRWLTAAVAAVAAFALLATLVGVIALREKKTADQVALAADAGRLAALSATAGDIPTSLVMAAAAYRLTDSPETRGALLSAEQRSSGELFRQTFDNQLLRVSPIGDGSRLLVMDSQRTMLTVDPATRTVRSRFGAPGEIPGGVSPDGKSLVMCGVGDAGTAVLVDTATGDVRRTITTSSSMAIGRCGAFTGDGKWYVALFDLPVPGTPFTKGGDVPNAIAVYSTANWTAPQRVLHVDPRVTAFDVGASEFAFQLEDGTLQVVSPATLVVREHAERPELATNNSCAECRIALSPDGSRLAFVDPTAPQSPRLVDTAALGGRTVSGQGTSATITAMGFSRDGAKLAIGAVDGSFVVVDSATASTITSQPGNGGSIQDIAWTGRSSAQHLYTVGLDDALTSWQLSVIPHDLTLGATLLGDDGDATHLGDRIVATAGESVFTKNLVTGMTTSWPFPLETGEQVQWVLPSSDWSRAVVSTAFADGSARFRVVDMGDGRTLLDHRVSSWFDKNDPLIAAFNADGTALFAMTGHASVDVLDIGTDRVLRSFSVRFPGADADRIWVVPLGTDPQGRLLVEGDDSTALTSTSAGRWGTTGSTSSSPSVATPSDRIGLVDASTGAVTASTVIGPVPPFTWEWSADGARLVIGTSSGTLQVFDASTLVPVTARVLAHSGNVFASSFSPDGSMIVSSGSDGNVAFWDASTLRQLGSNIRLGPASWVFAWYLPDGRIAGMMPATPADTSPNRLFLMSGTPSAWLADACDFAARDLGPDEWARLVPDQPYRPTCPSAPAS